ncbi:hypothetical protein J0S82_004498 [Galemys pyrenaicus]|uniref:Uncharacterized protein n=1 Tax=Galemys pyrenaicus TaxID=202257 RepID=A0A8J6ACL1_GALPY|nr:hypothetical protein J0S82_004498 [Galemys pyrenaicus]
MLITLCYLYLWARWGRRPAALVRTTVQRLRASRCSFTFCGAAARPRDARVCLSRGGRVFCVGESQSIDDLSKWTVFRVAPVTLGAEHIAFVTESTRVREERARRPSSPAEAVSGRCRLSPISCSVYDPTSLSSVLREAQQVLRCGLRQRLLWARVGPGLQETSVGGCRPHAGAGRESGQELRQGAAGTSCLWASAHRTFEIVQSDALEATLWDWHRSLARDLAAPAL